MELIYFLGNSILLLCLIIYYCIFLLYFVSSRYIHGDLNTSGFISLF